MGCILSKAEVATTKAEVTTTTKAGGTRVAATEPAVTPVNGRPIEPRGLVRDDSQPRLVCACAGGCAMVRGGRGPVEPRSAQVGA